MALPELMARLERDADERVAAIQAKARAEAAAIAEAAREQVAARRAQALAERRRSRRAALELELAGARQASRAEVLEARRALLARLRERTVAALLAAPQPAALEVLARGALRHLEGVPARVRCSEAAVQAIAVVTRAAADLEVVIDAATPPGLIFEARDGSVRVDATLEALLDRAWPRLSVELLAEVER